MVAEKVAQMNAENSAMAISRSPQRERLLASLIVMVASILLQLMPGLGRPGCAGVSAGC